MGNIILILLGVVIGALGAAFLVFVLLSRQIQKKISEYEDKIRKLQSQHQEEIRRARQESVDRSRATIKGQVSEQLVPLLPGFEFHPSDARFIGHPIDYVIFDGYTRLKDEGGNPEDLQILILDIKRNMARLTREQLAIAQAIQAGRVKFQVVRIGEDGKVHSAQLQKKS